MIELLNKEFPNFKIGKQTTSEPSDFYVIKNDNLSINIEDFKEFSPDDDRYIGILINKNDNIYPYRGYSSNDIEDIIKWLKNDMDKC